MWCSMIKQKFKKMIINLVLESRQKWCWAAESDVGHGTQNQDVENNVIASKISTVNANLSWLWSRNWSVRSLIVRRHTPSLSCSWCKIFLNKLPPICYGIILQDSVPINCTAKGLHLVISWSMYTVQKHKHTSGQWRLWYKYCISLREQSPVSTGVLIGPAIPGCASGGLSWGWREMPIWDGCIWANGCNNCCCLCCNCASLCCWIKAWSCGFCCPWRWRELWPWSSCWISCCCSSSCLTSILDFFGACNAPLASIMGCDVTLEDLRFCNWSWGGLCCTMEPSMTEEPEMLFDENDIGDAGTRMNESVFMLLLGCNWAPPVNDELASVITLKNLE